MEANLPVTAPEQGVLANSKAELLEWMKGGNKTLGWDAVVAFDRATVNNTFRQQYIQRFSESSLYPPFGFNKNTTGTLYRYVSNCVLSEPIISFIDAKLTDSQAPARVSLELISGAEVTLDYSPDPTAIKINALSALGSPVLEMKNTLALTAEPGQVGAITVDLSKGDNYTLSSGDSSGEIDEFGKMFKAELAKWSDEQRIWVVNRIQKSDGPLGIKNVFLRCQPAPGNNVRNAESYGDGAVVGFVQMMDGEEGNFPNDTGFKYLVPNEGPRYTTSIVLSRTRLLKAIGSNIFRETAGWISNAPTFSFQPGGSNGGTLVFDGGSMSRGSAPYRVNEILWSKMTPGQSWGFYRGAVGGLTLANGSSGELYVDFVLSMVELSDSYMLYEFPDPVRYRGQVKLNATGASRVQLDFNPERQVIETSQALEGAIANIGVLPVDYAYPLETWESVRASLLPPLETYFYTAVRGLSLRSSLLEVLPLSTLLFSGSYSTRLSDVAYPYDMIMFGHIAPQVNAFEITTQLPVLVHGSTHSFMVDLPQPDIIWSVANLPGENEPKGTINPTTGIYTAPAATDISGRQVRVKVTATKGEATSTALVTILKNTVNVNPRVQYLIANSAGTASCDFAAGALSDMGITWTPPPATAGTLTNSSNPNRDKMFTAVAREPSKGLEVVRVAVSARGGTENAYVLVKHADAVLAVTARDIDVSQQTVLLEATLASDPAPGVHQWSILAGSGSIDERGVLTADADPAEPFVFVQVKIEALPGYNFYGYLLLPLPLAPYPERSAASLTTAVLGE